MTQDLEQFTINVDLNTFLRPELKTFVIQMEEEMRANDHKGKDGWKTYSESHLFAKLLAEIQELYEAMVKARTVRETHRYIDDVISECADVANFAMMLADNVTKKREGATHA
jgi:NTP pyrophosphatase (non-canonical NTP hydrolase)